MFPPGVAENCTVAPEPPTSVCTLSVPCQPGSDEPSLAALKTQLVGESQVMIGGLPTVTVHGAPGTSGEAFAPGAVLLLPLRLRAGIRMRALEAWASSVPIVASTAALDGLDATPDMHALVADTPADFAEAVARLHRSPDVRTQLVEAGLAHVRARHAARAVANATLDVYRDAIARHATR